MPSPALSGRTTARARHSRTHPRRDRREVIAQRHHTRATRYRSSPSSRAPAGSVRRQGRHRSQRPPTFRHRLARPVRIGSNTQRRGSSRAPRQGRSARAAGRTAHRASAPRAAASAPRSAAASCRGAADRQHSRIASDRAHERCTAARRTWRSAPTPRSHTTPRTGAPTGRTPTSRASRQLYHRRPGTRHRGCYPLEDTLRSCRIQLRDPLRPRRSGALHSSPSHSCCAKRMSSWERKGLLQIPSG
jgi:hypothetical protein